MTKRKHDEIVERSKVDVSDVAVGPLSTSPAAPAEGNASSRQMQGQGEKKHTIDSDDEDDEREKEKKFATMKDDDIEGQEDNTVNFDGDIQITPFNLKEEQQEGAFSKDGDFVWHEKKDQIKDAWLDDIDWVKVKERTDKDKKKKEEEDEQEDEDQLNYSEMKAYREILALLQPKESVAKALRRLGGNKKPLSASERWKKKKAGKAEDDPQEKQNKETMLKLSGLADSILSRSGNMEVYEETFESITFKLAEDKGGAGGAGKTSIPDDVDDDDALDMFASSLDTETGKSGDNAEINDAAPSEEKRAKLDMKSDENGTKSTKETPLVLSDEVMWEFKWKNEEDAEVHGPHSSTKMLEWQESGFFQQEVWCRKAGSNSSFSTSKRIDFDLYT